MAVLRGGRAAKIRPQGFVAKHAAQQARQVRLGNGADEVAEACPVRAGIGAAGREKNDMIDLRLDGLHPADGSYRL